MTDFSYEEFKRILPIIYELTSPKHLDNNINVWDSLIIDRRKPETTRLFTQLDDYRICLHIFEPCEEAESFTHPHAWPAMFSVLDGEYKQNLFDSDGTRHISESVHVSGSFYNMCREDLWHQIIPSETTYTIMINGPNYHSPHPEVKTTKGKDLDRLDKQDMRILLYKFNYLIHNNFDYLLKSR